MSIVSNISARLKGDRVIWLIVALLSLGSMLLIYSSTENLAYRKMDGDTEHFLLKQGIILGSGLLFMFVFHRIPYMNYAKLAVPALMFSVGLLAVTLLTGGAINSASRWLQIPIIGTFQTSDLAKMALILYMAKMLSGLRDRFIDQSVAQGSLLHILIPVMLTCGLIAPANLSTAVILFVTCVMMLYIGRVQMTGLWYVLILAIALFAVLVLLKDVFPSIRVDTWVNRLQNFMGAEENMEMNQVNAAKIAISKGGFFGAGPGNSSAVNFLTHAYSDFIYCVIIEEYGLFGGLVTILLYLGLLWRCVRMVTKSTKKFGSFLALGLCLMLVLQALMHMAVNVNLVPVTGLTLPLISMGGTSLIFTCLSLGVILSVSAHMETSES